MNTHSIDLIRYCARSRGNSTIYLGTAGSHGNEQLQVTRGKGWEGLTVQVVFHPCKVAVQLPANGVLDVPWEATARPLTALQGRIVFQGFDQDRLVNSTDLAYTVASHSPALGRDEQPYTPGIVEGVLNQMAADKDAILQAAQQTGQAKEATAASAAAAASSAANAQQSAGAANTSAGQAAASASQAAGSAAAANETLTQVQTAGQEAQQKVKDAETEALGNISAAAPALPAVSAAAAWQSVTAKPDGTGYNLAAMAPIEATIRPTVTGNPAVCEDSAAWAFQGLKIYGKSTQDGTPSPENPVPIVSAGDGGELQLNLLGKNLFDASLIASKTVGGATLTNNGDGSFTVSGTGQLSERFESKYEISKSEVAQLFTVGKVYGLRKSKDDYPTCPYFRMTIDGSTEALDGFDLTKSILDNLMFIKLEFIGAAGSEIISGVVKPMVYQCGDNVWEPYKTPQSLTISTPNGLPGIPVESGGNFTDADGQQLVCDVIDLGTGIKSVKVIKDVISSVDKVDPRNIGFRKNAVANKFENISWASVPNAFCSRLPIVAYNNVEALTASISFVSASDTQNWGYTVVLPGIEQTLEAYNQYLAENPITIVAVAGEAGIQEVELPAEELAAYKALTTYPGTTVVSTAEPVAGIEASYMMDGNKYRESVDKRLAALEAAQTGI